MSSKVTNNNLKSLPYCTIFNLISECAKIKISPKKLQKNNGQNENS
jgi:hypothetical protein